ncbi:MULTISPECIES: family 20 glycosylhydrolase [unclassified Kitasatospora]|uniref:family 20 glycosylhydrolase n=1 Tax=unclassified Kitasatospora TaxID=2633591 RepID=UPI00070DA4D4|nr:MULTISPECIES: family 20 glycosylhydrolase [unclassified Kitasatospora]KQV12399.1 beta-N-acetylhexosaminidase [Kitasatospora sp. Root107]KRB66901.1 beta-N-acetylhexosaminidase [Kitasatospora sp. Root187]
MKRPLAATVAATVAIVPLAFLTAAPSAQAAGSTPKTVPALRQWTSGTGSFTFGATSRVVVDPAYATQLTVDANTFATDLSALEGRTVSVVQGTAAAGDIALTLGGSQSSEGYTMTVGSSIKIQASTATGQFWGTRSMLQLLHQGNTVAAGTATDSPTKPERGLMLDTGRNFFPVDWVENQIRDMSYLKLNYLHLHLSDHQGFRLESSTHPEITSAQHYSKQDIRNIIALGNKYHVQVVPEIDVPGHMDAILSGELAIGNDYRLKDSAGNVSSSFIDLTIPGARTLISDLINEYLPLFTTSSYWHLGADEYVTNYGSYPQLLTYARANYGATAKAKDVYYGFVNWADSLVRAKGRTMRMWNDGIGTGDGALTPNSDIVVEYWYGFGKNPQQLIDAGYEVANASWTPTYYIYGKGKPDTKWMYESWTPDLFQGTQTINAPSKNRGSLIHVWCDTPTAETVDQTAAGIKNPLRDLAQQVWGSPKPVATYAEFVPIMDAIGRNPLWPTTVVRGNLAQGKPTAASSVEVSSFPAVNATDGSMTTRWSSQAADPSWIQVDLGSVQTVNRVGLAWEAAYGKDYQIQMSNDGTTWTTVYTRTGGTGGTETLTGFTGTGRYIRMNGTARGTVHGYSLYEFQVFHDVDLALNRPTTASSVEPGTSFTADLATDGKSTTRWASAHTDPQWLQVDLGATHAINEVKLNWEYAYGKAYQIQVSDDGTHWITLYSTTTSTGGVQDLTGLVGNGRYIRIKGTVRGTSYGYSLWSFEVYGA